MAKANISQPAAIPTTYNGVELKSRLEAQCAYLFDRLGWEWRYEPKSYMLPNGVSYMPDFFIPDQGLFVECRGYHSDKGQLQLQGFNDLMKQGVKSPTCPEVNAGKFLVLRGDYQAEYYDYSHGFRRAGMFLLIHCQDCGWNIAPISESGPGFNTNIVEFFCPSCIAPMSSFSWHKWDGKPRIDKAAIVTTASGKILVNGVGVEEWETNRA